MASIRVVIQDQTRSKKTLVELPDDVPMERLLPVLASRMQLPLTQGGNPIVYHLDHRSSGRRLSDETTLHGAGVSSDDVLTLLPEVTAGGGLVSGGWGAVRNRRLKADHRRLQRLAEESELIRIDEANGQPPERYLIGFACRGVVGIAQNGPQFGHQHQVMIELPVGYPTHPPYLRWMTPIFHPNIEETGNHVCIDTWYPSKFLDELCIMLGRMIQYKNYNPYDSLRSDAALWAAQNVSLFPVDRRPLRRGEEVRDKQKFEIQFL